MAVTNFIDKSGLTMSPAEAEGIFVKKLYASDLHNTGIRFMPGLKQETKLHTGKVNSLYSAYTCDFVPQADAVLLEETSIKPEKLSVSLEECYDEFRSTWMVAQTEASLNGGIPKDFYTYFFEDVMLKELDKEYEEIFWNADKEAGEGYLATANGILKQVKDNEHAVKVEGSALTVANILGEVEKVATKVMDLDNIDTTNYKIFMNYQDFRKLVTALGKASADGVKNIDTWSNYTRSGEKVYAFGFEVVPCRIEKGYMIASDPSNLVLGFDVENNTEFKIIDMRETTGSDSFRVRIITSIAAGIVYPETIVAYTQA